MLPVSVWIGYDEVFNSFYSYITLPCLGGSQGFQTYEFFLRTLRTRFFRTLRAFLRGRLVFRFGLGLGT
jgi:hypothetical protein